MSIGLNTRFVSSVTMDELKKEYLPKLKEIYNNLILNKAEGIEMTGWLSWPFKDHSQWIKQAEDIRLDWIDQGVKVVVIVGTGGSYLGTKACLEFVNDSFEENHFEFLFLPYFADRYLDSTLRYLKNKKFAIVVISKSGGTLESAVSFRLLRQLLFDQEKEGHNRYIISITSKGSGVLYEMTEKHRYHFFEIEKSIGGRYSTLTPVGVVPAILSGISGKELLRGAEDCYKDQYHADYSTNLAFQYAAYRNYFFEKKGLVSECLISYEPQLNGILHKMKQLFSESEGKNDKGLMPVIFDFTPDLHSVGQLLQEGKTTFFETILWVNESERLLLPETTFGNEDKLDWLRNTPIKEINNSAFLGTVKAHSEVKGINALVLNLQDWSPYTFGYLYFFLCLSAMFSAYLFGQNPFDQPGVEAYKARMIALLKTRSEV
ncbi:glucose-6-phosphate isomerase [Candidatus Mycoplasma haematolamae str. Purdue]|uniref:Glucose-6-phosphate isomerase n=1 Tax=Mycoplasma haematolamae (strain Purdue) TaxID=1212765 RepID=I7C528_MYCHA|nr:glucose-6-phosphate isomerase [Candidatus Mycoplasma haematolamae]AFO51592.1 glucose-6-phosphate isomerase [Candidatus Mycoplasma haematolamae str. Purdue]